MYRWLSAQPICACLTLLRIVWCGKCQQKRRIQCRDDVDGCNNLLASPKVGIGGECVLEFHMHVCSKEEIGQQSERRKKHLQIPFTGIHLWNPQILGILQMACIDLWPWTFTCFYVRLSMGQRQSSTTKMMCNLDILRVWSRQRMKKFPLVFKTKKPTWPGPLENDLYKGFSVSSSLGKKNSETHRFPYPWHS